MTIQPIEFDDLENGMAVEVTLKDDDARLSGWYVSYERHNGLHLLVFDIQQENRVRSMWFETMDIGCVYQVLNDIPVAEASTDFDPSDLGNDYPC